MIALDPILSKLTLLSTLVTDLLRQHLSELECFSAANTVLLLSSHLFHTPLKMCQFLILNQAVVTGRQPFHLLSMEVLTLILFWVKCSQSLSHGQHLALMDNSIFTFERPL